MRYKVMTGLGNEQPAELVTRRHAAIPVGSSHAGRPLDTILDAHAELTLCVRD